jgi:hypothetical protein
MTGALDPRHAAGFAARTAKRRDESHRQDSSTAAVFTIPDRARLSRAAKCDGELDRTVALTARAHQPKTVADG